MVLEVSKAIFFLTSTNTITMRTILDMADSLAGLLKPQQPDGEESYRLMRFVVSQPVEGGVLLYNVLTKSLVLLDDGEAERMMVDPASVPGLVENWFAVPQSHDDRKLAQEVRAVGRMLERPVRSLKSYTILTTTDCNARCFYCYEKGRSRIPMSDDTAVATARYIIRNSPEGKVHLRWFGGEPLYNKKVISLICSLLNENGFGIRSSMVSNGLLFDDATVTEAVQEWKLNKVQITLDGTEKVYNRVKNYVDPVGNPFLRVMGNIHRLVDAKVKVNVRLNIDRHNAEDLFILAEQLGEAFGGNPLVNVYSHSLFETCAPGASVKRSDSQRKALFDTQMRLRERLKELGLSKPAKLGHSIKLNHCMADSDGSVVILPDGHVGKCEHYSDSDWFAHVMEEGRDESVLEGFKALRPEFDFCAECPCYPDCFRLVKCEESAHCYPEERTEKVSVIRQQMMNLYENHEVQD